MGEMLAPAALVFLLRAGGQAFDKWRQDRFINRWITETFGKVSDLDRIRIRALYFGR